MMAKFSELLLCGPNLMYSKSGYSILDDAAIERNLDCSRLNLIRPKAVGRPTPG